MVLREIEFGFQDVSIALEPLDELSHIRLVAPGCGVSKTRHSVSTIFAAAAEKYFSSC